MPHRDWRQRIEDILAAVRRIQEHVSGSDFEAFARDAKLVDAVLYQIVVIGEAARQVPDEVTSRYVDVPWLEMRDMRNVVTHAYFGVSLDIVWQTVVRDLPPLVDALGTVLEAERSQGEA